MKVVTLSLAFDMSCSYMLSMIGPAGSAGAVAVASKPEL